MFSMITIVKYWYRRWARVRLELRLKWASRLIWIQTKQQQQQEKRDTQLEATLLICFVFSFDFLLFILECDGICFQLMYWMLRYVNKPIVSFQGHYAVSAVVSFLKLSSIIVKNIMHHMLNIYGRSSEWYLW